MKRQVFRMIFFSSMTVPPGKARLSLDHHAYRDGVLSFSTLIFRKLFAANAQIPAVGQISRIIVILHSYLHPGGLFGGAFLVPVYTF